MSVRINLSIATLTLQQKKEWILEILSSIPEIPYSFCLQLPSLKITQQCFSHLLHTFLRLFSTAHHHHAFPLLHLSAFRYFLLLILSSTFKILPHLTELFEKIYTVKKIRMFSIYPLLFFFLLHIHKELSSNFLFDMHNWFIQFWMYCSYISC